MMLAALYLIIHSPVVLAIGREREIRLNPKFMNLMNEHRQVVTQDLAQGFVDHRSIGLRTKTVTKFALHHAEGRFDVRPLVIVRQEVAPAIHKVVKHFLPRFNLSAPFFSPIAGAAIRFKRDERNCAGIRNDASIVIRQVPFVRRYFGDLEA
jgi:hypothetical protein